MAFGTSGSTNTSPTIGFGSSLSNNRIAKKKKDESPMKFYPKRLTKQIPNIQFMSPKRQVNKIVAVSRKEIDAHTKLMDKLLGGYN